MRILREPWAWAMVGTTLVATGILAWSPLPNWDELTVASDAVRQLHGQVIYRDFFEFIGPLASWVALPVLAVTGPSMVALRLVASLIVTLAAGLSYRAARQLEVPAPLATLPGLALALAAYPLFPLYSHHWLAVLAATGALTAAFSGLVRTRAWLLAGLATGLAGLAVQSDGIALAAALVAWIGLDAVLGEGRRAAPRRLAWLALGITAALAPAMAYLGVHGALGAAWADTIRWPLSHYRQASNANDVAYLADLQDIFSTTQPGFRRWAWYTRDLVALALELLPLAAVAVAAARAADALRQRWRQGRSWSPFTSRLALAGLVTAALLAVAMRGRCDLVHLAFLAPPAWLVLVGAIARLRARLAASDLAMTTALPVAALVALLVGSVALTVTAPQLRPRAGGADRVCLEGPALSYMQAHGGPETSVVAWPYGALFYFYGHRPTARYSVIFDPRAGYNTAEEYQAFWAEVATNHPRFVIFTSPEGHRYPTPPQLPIPGYRFTTVLPMYEPLPAHDVPPYPSYLYEASDR